MSQRKQQSWEPPRAPKCSPLQCPHPCLAPCPAPSCSPGSGGGGSGSQSSEAQKPAHSRRTHQELRCLRGGTVYHIKEEEC
ncbi:late cornified envelope 6A [Rhinolophus ferrumequinum]|uniref:Late cornified envelope 6A n=2 Tax=Rhinolophus ferrumequinum TaxID=59479 RepID=A0A7J7SYB3_RHIFE|nr:late cornified envelope 6A [Rhinolophus ferrumequinum]